MDFSAFDNSPAGQYLKSLGTPEFCVPELSNSLQQFLNSDRLTLAQFVGRFWELRETDPKAAFRHTVYAQSATEILRLAFLDLDALAPILLPTALVAKVNGNKAPDALKTFCQTEWNSKRQSIIKTI